jgi:hypothetical protein
MLGTEIEPFVRFQGRRMIPNSPTLTIPLRRDEHGAIWVGQTSVLLELMILI